MTMKKMVLVVVAAIMVAFGGGFAGGMEYASEKDEQAADLLIKATSTVQANTDHALDVWRTQAQACQAKFDVVTVLYESTALGPAQAPSLPLLHGMLSLSLNDPTQRATSGPHAVWAIPAQVTPQSPLPGAQYVWINRKTNEVQGTFRAQFVGSQVIQ